MIITFPKSVKSNFKGYNNFIQFASLLKNSEDIEIKISLKHSEIFEANLVAILGAVIDSAAENQKKIEYVDIPVHIRELFTSNNFLKSTSQELLGRHRGTVISFMKFTQYKDIEFMDYVKNELLSKPDFPKHSKMLGKKINESIFELFENARTHGHCNNIFTCGQIIQEEGISRLDFTIVDLGRTIKYNVNDYLNANLSGSDAIEWALKSGHTTKTGNVSGGLGLDIIFEFIKLNKGRIQIVSSDGYWEYFNDSVEKKSFNEPFNGTVANIEFNLNDKSSYRLREEIPLEDIF
jgi:hypothetical protein